MNSSTKIYPLVLVLFMLLVTACDNRNAERIVAKDLIGKYEVDVKGLIKQIREKERENIADALGGSLALFMLENMKVQVIFDSDSSFLIGLGGGLMDMFSSLMEEGKAKPMGAKYKIQSDSLFYIKQDDMDEYEKIGVIKKPAKDYSELLIKFDADDFSGELRMIKSVQD
jgi:hypothetical protein